MEVITKNVQEPSEDTNRQMHELKKKIKNKTDQFTKESKSINMFKSTIQEIKNNIECLGIRTG